MRAAIPTLLLDIIEIDPPWGMGGEWGWVGGDHDVGYKGFFSTHCRSENIELIVISDLDIGISCAKLFSREI